MTNFTYYKPSCDNLKCFSRSSKFRRVGLGQHSICSKDKSDLVVVSGLSLLHFKWRSRQHMINKVMQNESLLLVQDDGTTTRRRGGHSYGGESYYESEDIDKWIAVNVGSSSDVITGLSGFLS